MVLSLKKHFWKRNVPISEELQLRFLKRLLRLLKNGYPILKALERLNWDQQLSPLASVIIIKLKHGNPIDQAFEQANFHSSITSYLYFIRANNDLESSLEKAIEMFEQRITNGKKFRKIIRYPVVLTIIFSSLLYFVKQSVLPSFLDIFTEEANKTVHYSIQIMNILSTTIVILILCSTLFGIFWYFVQRKIPIEKQLIIYQKIPIYKNYIKLQTSYFFATHFGSLLKTGMSYKEILHHMKHQEKLPIISHYAGLIMNDLSLGIHLSYVVSQLKFLDEQLSSIFQQDIDIHALELDLTIYGEMLMEDIEEVIVRILTWLQPIILILIGGFIIFLYISLMWPMFQLIKTI